MGRQQVGRRVAVVTMADRRYFPGVLALWASLSLQELRPTPSFCVIDLGLTRVQRDVLQSVGALLLDARRSSAASPVYAKPTFRRLLTEYDVVCYCDADVVVLGDLKPWLEQANGGVLVAYPDGLDPRHSPHWADVVVETDSPRDLPYVNAGFLIFGQAHAGLLKCWDEVCSTVSDVKTVKEAWVPEGPWMFGDQDALNAVLRYGREVTDVHVIPNHPPPVLSDHHADRLRVGTEPSPWVRWDDHDVTVWHWAGSTNPWEDGATNVGQREARSVWNWFIHQSQQQGLLPE